MDRGCTVVVHDDFDLHKIADSGQCFRCARLEDGSFRFISGDKVLYIRHLEKKRQFPYQLQHGGVGRLLEGLL